MKTLVVYDSLFGNTGKVARAIGKGIRAKGVKVAALNEVNYKDLKGTELLFVGSPTHGGRPSQPMQKFLSSIPDGYLKGIYAASFDTGISVEGQNFILKFIIRTFGYASPHIARKLKKCGADIVGSETFFVTGKEGPLKDGELVRAEKWAAKMFTSL